jgi:hypothetical protein
MMMLTNGLLSVIVANGLQAKMVRRKPENLKRLAQYAHEGCRAGAALRTSSIADARHHNEQSRLRVPQEQPDLASPVATAAVAQAKRATNRQCLGTDRL